MFTPTFRDGLPRQCTGVSISLYCVIIVIILNLTILCVHSKVLSSQVVTPQQANPIDISVTPPTSRDDKIDLEISTPSLDSIPEVSAILDFTLTEATCTPTATSIEIATICIGSTLDASTSYTCKPLIPYYINRSQYTWSFALDTLIPCLISKITMNVYVDGILAHDTPYVIGSDDGTILLPPAKAYRFLQWSVLAEIPSSESFFYDTALSAREVTLHGGTIENAESSHVKVLWQGWNPPGFFRDQLHIYHSDDGSTGCIIDNGGSTSNPYNSVYQYTTSIGDIRAACGITSNTDQFPYNIPHLSFHMNYYKSPNTPSSPYDVYNQVIASLNTLTFSSIPLIQSYTLRIVNIITNYDSGIDGDDDGTGIITLPTAGNIITLTVTTTYKDVYKIETQSVGIIAESNSIGTEIWTTTSTIDTTNSDTSSDTLDVSLSLYDYISSNVLGKTSSSFPFTHIIKKTSIEGQFRVSSVVIRPSTPLIQFIPTTALSIVELIPPPPVLPPASMAHIEDVFTLRFYTTADYWKSYTLQYNLKFEYTHNDIDYVSGSYHPPDIYPIERPEPGLHRWGQRTEQMPRINLFELYYRYLVNNAPSGEPLPPAVKRMKFIAVTGNTYDVDTASQTPDNVMSKMYMDEICAPPMSSDCSINLQDRCNPDHVLPWDYTQNTLRNPYICECLPGWSGETCSTPTTCDTAYISHQGKCTDNNLIYTEIIDNDSGACIAHCGCRISNGNTHEVYCSGHGMYPYNDDDDDEICNTSKQCICDDKWYGDTCQHYTECSNQYEILNQCSLRGYIDYDVDTDTCSEECTCYQSNEWDGITCEQPMECSNASVLLKCQYGYVKTITTTTTTTTTQQQQQQCASECSCLFGFSGTFCTECNIKCYQSSMYNPKSLCQYDKVNLVPPCLCPMNTMGTYCQYIYINTSITLRNLSLPLWLIDGINNNHSKSSTSTTTTTAEQYNIFINDLTSVFITLFNYNIDNNVLTNIYDTTLDKIYQQDHIQRVYIPQTSLSYTTMKCPSSSSSSSQTDDNTNPMISVPTTISFQVSIRVGERLSTLNKDRQDVYTIWNNILNSTSKPLASYIHDVFAVHNIPRIGQDVQSSTCIPTDEPPIETIIDPNDNDDDNEEVNTDNNAYVLKLNTLYYIILSITGIILCYLL